MEIDMNNVLAAWATQTAEAQTRMLTAQDLKDVGRDFEINREYVGEVWTVRLRRRADPQPELPL